MKKYKILRTVKGVRPGELHPTVFEKDTEHHIDDDLASQLYDQGAIDMINVDTGSDEKSEEKPEEKSRGAAPLNKNRGASPSNKNKATE